MKYFIFLIIACIAGANFPLAFAPFHFVPLGIFSLATFCALLCNIENKKQAASIGLFFGLGAFGVGASWVYHSIHDYGFASPLLAGFLTVLFVLVLASFTSAMGFFFQLFFKKALRINQVLGFAILWTLFEWIRGFAFTGFPWLFIGVSQINTPLAGFAPIVGVYGVSLLSALLAAILFSLFKSTRIQAILQIILIVMIFGSGFYLSQQHWTYSDKSIQAALVQGNVPQHEKWDPRFLKIILKKYWDLVESVPADTLIILPEGALPTPLPAGRPFVDKLAKLAASKQQTLLFGAPVTDSKKQFYNGLLSVGSHEAVYFKKHLVPFGEYVPFEQFLRGMIRFFDLPMSAFIEGTDSNSVMRLGSFTLAPLICYEIAYPEQVRIAAKNSEVIVTISDDSWFGHSIGPHQHLQIAAFRALENERYVLRATNTGITAVINEKGKVIAKLPSNEVGILKAQVRSLEGLTPWSSYGTRPIIALLCALGAGLALFEHRRLTGLTPP